MGKTLRAAARSAWSAYFAFCTDVGGDIVSSVQFAYRTVRGAR